MRRGDVVTIKKGTAVRSTHPRRSRWVAARTYQVLLAAVYDETFVAVGHRSFDAEGEVAYEDWSYYSRRDRELVEEKFGTSEPEELKKFVVEKFRGTRADGSSYVSLMLPVEPAKVRWAGRGGYWCTANMADVMGER